jgi:hypothetical protein
VNSVSRMIVVAPVAVLCLASGAWAQGANGAKIPHPLPSAVPLKTASPAVPTTGKQPATDDRGLSQTRRQPDAPKSEIPQVNGHTIAPAVDQTKVFFDAPGDGSLWAIGRAYKSQFNTNGATYIPFLGSNAPQLYPVSFGLQSVTVGGNPLGFSTNVDPVQTGSTIGFDRGSVLENYALNVGSVEQTFTFGSLPVGGDLVVRVGIDTALAFSESPDGLRFGNELGYVSYGHATAIDASGHSVAATSIFEDGAVEIRVPASFLASAAYPVTIDPIVTTFGVDTSASIDSSPDVAFTGGRYLACFERVFAATDHDVWAQQYDLTGTLVAGSGAYIDFTTSYWATPRAASNNIANNYMVVAAVGDPAAVARVIMGRTRDAASTTMGVQFTISTGASGSDQFYPDVGGDPVTVGPTYYMVTWESTFAATDHDIYARLVSSGSVLQGTGPIFVDFSTQDDNRPTISKCDGQAPFTFANQRWTIVWDRVFVSTDHDIYGSQYLWDGSLVNGTFLIDFSGSDDMFAMASSLLDGTGTGERDYLVVYQRDLLSDHNIRGQVLNGTASLASGDISALEGASFVAQDQISPSVDSDGVCYILSYSEQYTTSTTDYDQYIDSISRSGGSIQVQEHHQNLDFLTTHTDRSEITSIHSGGGGPDRCMVVWESGPDIRGGLYDACSFASFCYPNDFFDGTIPCPCSNPPSTTGRGCNNSSATGGAILTGAGNATLSADTVVLTSSGEKPTATSIFLQGTSANFNGVAFGQGVRCVAGTLKRLYTHAAVGGVVSAPVGSDPSIHVRSAALGDTIDPGSSRYYMVYYRDPTVLGGCSAGSTFNATQGGAYCWAP